MRLCPNHFQKDLTSLGLCNCLIHRIGQLEDNGEWSKGAGLFPYLIRSAVLWKCLRSMSLAPLILEEQVTL